MTLAACLAAMRAEWTPIKLQPTSRRAHVIGAANLAEAGGSTGVAPAGSAVATAAKIVGTTDTTAVVGTNLS